MCIPSPVIVLATIGLHVKNRAVADPQNDPQLGHPKNCTILLWGGSGSNIGVT